MQPGFTTYRTNSTPSKRASGVRRNQAAKLRTSHNINNSNELAQDDNTTVDIRRHAELLRYPTITPAAPTVGKHIRASSWN